MKILSKQWISERIRVYLFNHLLNCGCIVLVFAAIGLFVGWENVRVDIESLIRSWFHVEISLDPEDSMVDESGRMTWVVTPNLCPSAPPAQLRVGDPAIQLKPGYIHLRSEPNVAKKESIIGVIHKCEFVTILDGPECADGYNFYQVRTDKLMEGWVAESNKDWLQYWLVPVLDGKKCNLPPIFVEGEQATSDHPSVGPIRGEPALNASKLPWSIVTGDTVKILDGPVCNDTYIWYKVHGTKHPDPGWAEMGRGNDYFFDIPVRFAQTNVEDADASCPSNP